MRGDAAKRQSLPPVALALCRFLDHERIEYGVVSPGGRGADLHLVVRPAWLGAVPSALGSFCAAQGLQLVACRQRERESWHCVLARVPHTGWPALCAVEIRGDFWRGGRRLAAAEELLARRSSVAAGETGMAFFAVAPAHAFLYVLLKCATEDELDETGGRALLAAWRADEQGARALLGNRLDPAWRELLVRALERNSWQAVRLVLPGVRASLYRHCRYRFPGPGDLGRALLRALRPEGVLVACLGPDGSGKTSLIEALGRRALPPFTGVQTMQLRPRVVLPHGVAPPTPNRADPARGGLGRLAKLLMFVFDYALGYWLRIRPHLVRGALVVFDRYYDDVLVDPVRYRLVSGRQMLARLLLPWVPRPGLWLVLDVPPDVLESRTTELPRDESQRQRAEYRRVLRDREDAVVLDAREPLERVVAQAERAIVAHLAQRTAHRFGLPHVTVDNPWSARLLLFFCRHRVPLLSRLVRIVFNSDIYCRLPPDIHLPHPYGVVMHAQAVIGRRVTVMQQVTLGGKDPDEGAAPVIGNDVFIGAGARVLGDVRIGDGAVIGANAVVTRDIPPGMTVVGANRIVRRLRGVPRPGGAGARHAGMPRP